MASQLHTQDFPQMPDYETAEMRYARRADAYPIRARTHGLLPLGRETQRDCKLWKGADATIHVRYHSTDVISYYPNGDIRLRRYLSRNTELLVNTVLDGHVQVLYENQPLGYGAVVLPLLEEPRLSSAVYGLLPHEARIYALGRYADEVTLRRVQGRLILVDVAAVTQPIEIPRVDRKAANARYRQYRLSDFTLFCEAQRQLGVLPSSLEAPTVDFPYRSTAGRLAMLQEQTHWSALYKIYGIDAPTQLRHDILRQHDDTLTVETLPWIAGADMTRVQRAQRQYHWRIR